MHDNQNYDQTPKRIRRKLRLGRVLVFCIFLGVIGFIVYNTIMLMRYMFFTERDKNFATYPYKTTADKRIDKNINLLVLGLDGNIENGEPRRTDSILLLSFNKSIKNVAVLSIPRDTRAQIAGKEGYEKINHAYAYGEEKLARQTVANLLDIPIDYHIVLDGQGFMHIIDVLGGVGVYVENDMNYDDPYQGLSIHLKKGYQKLTGEQAVKYIKFRNDELGDIGRVLRQQKFFKAFLDEFFSLSTVLKAPYIKDVFTNSVKTDIDLPSMTKMMLSFKKYEKESIKYDMLPGEFKTINSTSYWLTNDDEIRKELEKMKIKTEESK